MFKGGVYIWGGGGLIFWMLIWFHIWGGLIYRGVFTEFYGILILFYICIYIYIYYIYIYTYICILYIYTHFILNECAFSSETRVSHTWNVKSPPELIDSADVLMLLDNLNLMKVFKKN